MRKGRGVEEGRGGEHGGLVGLEGACAAWRACGSLREEGPLLGC